MPQLMPFYWVVSIFMVFVLLTTLVFMYNIVMNWCCFGVLKVNGMEIFMIKW